MKKVFILLFVALAFGLNAQNGAEIAPPHQGDYPQTNLMRAQWDVLQEFNTLDASQPGLETNGVHFFTSTWNDDYFQRYDMDGSNGVQFTIAGVGRVRDMAYVESTGLFYGSDASMTLYAMDLENQTLSATIPVTCSGVSGIRHIAYDPQLDGGAGGFWIGNWSSLGAIDMNGNQLVAGIVYNYGMYGSAYDNWTDPANPKLWIFCQNYVTGDDTMLAEYDINTQSFTGTSYDVADNTGDGSAGGACSYVRPDGTVALVVNIQIFSNPNVVREYELFAPASPVPVSNWAIFLAIGALVSVVLIKFVFRR